MKNVIYRIDNFINKARPRGPRPNKDIADDNHGNVKSQANQKFPEGASPNMEPKSSGLGGNYHTLPENTPMPDGLGFKRDGRDIFNDSHHSEGHATIFPTRNMPFSEFDKLFQSLPWKYGGRV